jgi:hypothetical protein
VLKLGVQGGGRGGGEVQAVLELGVEGWSRRRRSTGSAKAGCTGRRRRRRSTGSARAGCTGRRKKRRRSTAQC